jgi:N-acetylglucosaminyldiphosphoundecaprenol N-acetyl-beta-D-mannosaminyltransferase
MKPAGGQIARARRVRLLGVDVDAVRMDEAVAEIFRCLDEGVESCQCVVTPNVHHLVMLQDNEEFRQAYRHAALVVADGMPVILAARVLGQRLPERVAGSDLIPAVFEKATKSARRLRVYLLGAAPGVAARAAERIEGAWRYVEAVGHDSPPPGFEHDPAENERILGRIARVTPDLLLVGFGAPKQELWVDRHRSVLRAKVAVCVGATIDFLAGERRRAPLWMRRAGLEWLHRMAMEPGRLVGRYVRDGCVFPFLVWREIVRSRSSR